MFRGLTFLDELKFSIGAYGQWIKFSKFSLFTIFLCFMNMIMNFIGSR
jgi:hypothetical protein